MPLMTCHHVCNSKDQLDFMIIVLESAEQPQIKALKINSKYASTKDGWLRIIILIQCEYENGDERGLFFFYLRGIGWEK